MKANRVVVCLIVIGVIVLAALALKDNVKANFYIPGAGFSLRRLRNRRDRRAAPRHVFTQPAPMLLASAANKLPYG